MIERKQLGSLTELQCMSAFISEGYSVSIPYGDNNRYDFIADINGNLIRIQVKTASSKDNGKSYSFSCKSSRTNGKRTINKKYDKSEIDFFATFINGECYLVLVEECSTIKVIRFEQCANNQNTYVNYEENYRLRKQISNLLNK